MMLPRPKAFPGASCALSCDGGTRRDEEVVVRSDPEACGESQRFRIHGSPPYRVAVIHGGPGAGGEMEPVARELASDAGVFEPFQRARTLTGQVEELVELLAGHVAVPAVLVGYSWGAWLVLLAAARASEVARSLILVGSGPLEPHYADELLATRRSRLSRNQREAFDACLAMLEGNAEEHEKSRALMRLGVLARITDIYEADSRYAVKASPCAAETNPYHKVLAEALEMRRTGALLRAVSAIRCPVSVIHGGHDPHPAAGVIEPLRAVLPDPRFVLLKRCGHTPWIERHARGPFFRALREEIAAGLRGAPAAPEQRE